MLKTKKMNKINNQTALITGASGGIGYELAKIMAEKGHNLIISARSENKLVELKEELLKINNINVSIFPKDLSNPGSASELFKEIKSQNLEIDILVNNAGFGDYGYFYESNLSKQMEMIHLNVNSLTELTWLALNEMVKKQSGRILNVASTAAFQPGPLMSVYFATKAFVLHFSEAIANELKNKNISVTALCPGPTKTNFDKAASVGDSPMFNGKLPSANQVALFGYNKMMKGKTVAIHGFKYKFLVFAGRLAPRKMVTSMTRKFMEKK